MHAVGLDYAQNLKAQRASLLLQILLETNVYISVIWSLSYLAHMLYFKQLLWNYNGLFMLLAYLLAVIAESCRLYASYAANLGVETTFMWLRLSLTPFVLLPALLYLRLVALSQLAWLHWISNLMFLYIALEAIVALCNTMRCCAASAPSAQAAREETEQ